MAPVTNIRYGVYLQYTLCCFKPTWPNQGTCPLAAGEMDNNSSSGKDKDKNKDRGSGNYEDNDKVKNMQRKRRSRRVQRYRKNQRYAKAKTKLLLDLFFFLWMHKLCYPTIRDRSTWSKFRAHGVHGDVFLFSNLGAL